MALRSAAAGLRAWRAALGSGSGVLPALRSFSAQAEPVEGKAGFVKGPPSKGVCREVVAPLIPKALQQCDLNDRRCMAAPPACRRVLPSGAFAVAAACCHRRRARRPWPMVQPIHPVLQSR